jgi:hypothetical protein
MPEVSDCFTTIGLGNLAGSGRSVYDGTFALGAQARPEREGAGP